ncbi:class I SAM-dependent methyltransferase [Saccharicrinis sp. FJH62]|uniref:class I SAM-dependent methyltransferase n=1 Tax=Saccharicrinis sp. FJH62 TaxID=3344657 RepID=UPI0035D4BAEF
MQYDPIKRSLGNVFNKTPFLRKLFYRLLDILLLRTWHVKKELRLWKKNYPDKAMLLDAGSGFGQYTYYLSGVNPKWNVLGVDVKQEQIDDCNHFFEQINRSDRVKFEYADLTKFSKPETFDFILSVDVMEHILEDVEVFKNFNASLKKGGMLLISTPSDQGGSDTHHDHEHDEVTGFIDEHVRDGYGIREIEDKLKTAGFTKVDARYSYGKPGSLSWKISMKYPIQLLNVSKIFFIVIPFYYLILYPFALILNYFDVKNNHKTGTGLIVKAWK